jgi:hypothetical protein
VRFTSPNVAGIRAKLPGETNLERTMQIIHKLMDRNHKILKALAKLKMK